MTRLRLYLARHPNTTLVLRAGYVCLVELGKAQAVVPEVILYAHRPGPTADGHPALPQVPRQSRARDVAPSLPAGVERS